MSTCHVYEENVKYRNTGDEIKLFGQTNHGDEMTL